MTIYVARMADAAFPVSQVPAGTKVIAGYIGGDTPHVWSYQEWAVYDGYKKLPIFVHQPGASGVTEGWAALQRCYQLKIPKKTLIVIDVENNPDPTAVANFRLVVNWGGYYCGSYGSAATIFDEPVDYGYWVADWNNQAKLYPHKGVFATQYASPSIDPKLKVDLSVIRLSTYYLRLKDW